jgi:hypothetical protein
MILDRLREDHPDLVDEWIALRADEVLDRFRALEAAHASHFRDR